MEKDRLRQLVSQNLTIREIAEKASLSYTAIRYQLRKHGLKTRRGPHGHLNNKLRKELQREREQRPRKCSGCGETAPEKFYGLKTKMCAACHNQDCIKRGQEKRERMLAHLGGKCSACGFKKYRSALDIHHLDPEKKDPGAKHWRGWSWARIEEELKKCTILCKNCHAAVHAGELCLS